VPRVALYANSTYEQTADLSLYTWYMQRGRDVNLIPGDGQCPLGRQPISRQFFVKTPSLLHCEQNFFGGRLQLNRVCSRFLHSNIRQYIMTINCDDGRCVARGFLRSSLTFHFDFFEGREMHAYGGFATQLSDRVGS